MLPEQDIDLLVKWLGPAPLTDEEYGCVVKLWETHPHLLMEDPFNTQSIED